MNNEKIITLLEDGIDHYIFKEIVFSDKNIDWFKALNYKDLEDIVFAIRENSLGLYTFLPFCYVLLGVDMFAYYDKQLEKGVLGYSQKVSADFYKYPKSLYSKEGRNWTLDEFNVKKSDILKIRLRILSQGAKKVEYLKVVNQDLKVYFEDT